MTNEQLGGELGALYARYQALMAEANAFDMLDFLLVAVEAIGATGEDAAAARAALRASHTHLLVDEFQDTNALQLRLLELLCPAESGRITVVSGDATSSSSLLEPSAALSRDLSLRAAL